MGLHLGGLITLEENMGYFTTLILLLVASGLQATEREVSFSKSQVFSLTPEEMVFASKLSDENRRTFCYTFSWQERATALQGAKEFSPNESVDKVITLSSEKFQLIPN